MVLVSRAQVQNVRVGDELDIPDVEDHVHGEVLAGLLDGFELGRGAREGDDASVGEAAERADVFATDNSVTMKSVIIRNTEPYRESKVGLVAITQRFPFN